MLGDSSQMRKCLPLKVLRASLTASPNGQMCSYLKGTARKDYFPLGHNYLLLLPTGQKKNTRRRDFRNFGIRLSRHKDKPAGSLEGATQLQFLFVHGSLHLPLSFNECFTEPQESQTNSGWFPKLLRHSYPGPLFSSQRGVSVSQRNAAATVSSPEGRSLLGFFWGGSPLYLF